jgi:hypothetical protein
MRFRLRPPGGPELRRVAIWTSWPGSSQIDGSSEYGLSAASPEQRHAVKNNANFIAYQLQLKLLPRFPGCRSQLPERPNKKTTKT